MNKGLDIKVTNEKYSNQYARGVIIIDDFQEKIEIPIDYWNLSQYEYQWRKGKQRLKYYDSSCLVVAVSDFEQRPYINWWLLYKQDGLVYIQNQIIIGEIYQELIGEKKFTLESCYNFIPMRYIDDDEDEKVSEWCVSYDTF